MGATLVMEQRYEQFFEYMGAQPCFSEPVPSEIIEKYDGFFRGPDDESDVIVEFWREYGFAGFRCGLFWFINPEDYKPILSNIPEVSNGAVAFARTACGNLFVWDNINGLARRTIIHLNLHTQQRTIKSNEFAFFIEEDITTDYMWEKEFYGHIELSAVERLGPVGRDECLSFVPALSLGGEESVDNMRPQKIMPHLFILSQLWE